MSREIRRVDLDFDWPLRKVWQGFLMPDRLHETECEACGGTGYSQRARYLYDLWYGQVPFRPEDNGSTPFGPDTPQVWARAERNVTNAPEYYGAGAAILIEAHRLAAHFNGSWSHHLNADDVGALIKGGRLRDLTDNWTRGEGWTPKDPPVTPAPAEVNTWSIGPGLGHDAINAHLVIKARCAREDAAELCPDCGGHGATEAYPGQRAEADAWEPTGPPEGEGWQVWESVSEGSPVTPVFPTRAALVDHLCTAEQRVTLRQGPMSRHEAEAFVDAGWVPSGMTVNGQGIEGALAPGARGGDW